MYQYEATQKRRICTSHNVNYKELEELVLSNIQKVCKTYLDKNKKIIIY